MDRQQTTGNRQEATYRERIGLVLNELENIERSIPTNKYNFDLDQAIRALERIEQSN